MSSAIDYFLKIDGIEGESLDTKHKGQIEVLSWSFAEQQQEVEYRDGTGVVGVVRRVKFQDFLFTTNTSKASPKLFLACASAKHLQTAVLSCRRGAGFQLEFLLLKFSDLFVSG